MFNYLIKVGCRFFYFFMKFKKIKNNKVVFLSRLTNEKTLDFKLLEKELSKNKNVELIFLCKRIENMSDDIIGNFIYTLKCLNHLADAKVCVTDTYSLAVSAVKHKKDLKVIQIWHSMGAIKKFGLQSVGNKSGRSKNTAKVLGMHKNYDYIISGSEAMTKYFMKAYGYPKSSFLNYGLPRMDYLLNEHLDIKKKILKKYPILKKKENILYVPTFRTTGEDGTMEIVNNVNLDKYNLIVKGHANQELEKDERILDCSLFSALDLICIADYIITDYSGIAIEAAILNKKTLYYVFDYEEYDKNTGINIDLFKEMPNCCFKDSKKLCKYIEKDSYDMNSLIKYKNKYIDVKDGTSTKKICDLIIKCLRK